MALANVKKQKQMALPGTMGATQSGGGDITQFLVVYESLPFGTGTDPAAEDLIATLPTTAWKQSRKQSK